MNKNLNNPFYFLLSIIVCFNIFILYKYSDVLIGNIDTDDYAAKYSQSQYILGTESEHNISDSELYVYAAIAYSRGEDPTTINFEHPPLMKYIYGLSYLLVGNPYSLNIVLFSLALLTSYYFASILIKTPIFRIFVVVLIAIQPLFWNQAQYILLDLPMIIAVMLLFIVLHNNTITKPYKWIITGLLIGVIASIKYPIPFIFVILLIVFLVMLSNKEYKHIPHVVLSSATVYLAQYYFFFAQGKSFMDFIMFEKYRFSWWTGERDMPRFLIFESLFTGKHEAWWNPGTYQYSSEWNMLLPAKFVGFLASLVKPQYNLWFFMISAFGLGMVLLFGVSGGSSLRYLTLTLPFWLVIVVSQIERLTN